MKKLHSLLALLALFCGPLPAQTVPPLINYQGQLLGPGGANLPTADYKLTFNIYDAAQGGNRVWGPQIFDGRSGAGYGPKIPVVQGYFNVMLGPTDTNSVSLANAFSASARYVEIKVNDNSPIAPRQQILSAPFAIMAEIAKTAAQATDAISLAGQDWSAILVTGNDPSSGFIRGNKIADASLSGQKIIDRTITPSKIADYSIGNLQINDAIVDARILKDNAVTTAKIAAGALDLSRLAQEVIDRLVPPGTIIAFGGVETSIPQGWTLCDGAELSRSANARLWNVIGENFGRGDGSTTFNVPDLRGVFLRGVDKSSARGTTGRDPDATNRFAWKLGGNTGNSVGSYQIDALQKHNHKVYFPASGGSLVATTRGSVAGADYTVDNSTFTRADPKVELYAAEELQATSTPLSTSLETRPQNAYVNYIIKN